MNHGRILGLLPALLIAGISLGLVHSAFAGKKCLEDPTHPSCGSDGGGDAGGSTTATLGDAAGDGLTNDSNGPYVDGQDDVSVSIGREGNFVMKVGKGNKATIRTVTMNFSDCISGPCNRPFIFGSSAGPFNVFSSGVDLNGMNVGDSEDLVLEIRFNLDPVDLGLWELYYDFNSTQCPGGDYASVMRSADDTWAITGGLACLTEKSSTGGVETPAGIFNMTFLMVLHTT